MDTSTPVLLDSAHEQIRRVWRDSGLKVLEFYAAGFLPGLVHTEEYARRLFSDMGWKNGPDLEERIRLRLEEQCLILGRQPPIEVYVYITEAALRRVFVGDADARREQLDHLLWLNDQPNVRVRVVPIGSAEVYAPAIQGLLAFGSGETFANGPVLYQNYFDTHQILFGGEDACTYLARFRRFEEAFLTPFETSIFITRLALALPAGR